MKLQMVGCSYHNAPIEKLERLSRHLGGPEIYVKRDDQSGLATGGIYASLALALVMIYQATHLVNFAQGEMAMFATYIAWSLIEAGMPYWATLPISGAVIVTICPVYEGSVRISW